MDTAEQTAARRARSRRYVGTATVRTMIKRLERVLATATADDWAAGLDWYGRFGGVAEILADRYGVTVEQAAGVLAIVSPRVTVEHSVALARDVLATWTAGGEPVALAGLSDRLDAARRFLDGDLRPVALDGDGQLSRSRKVRSFFRNITGDDRAVTVDVWAARAVGSTVRQPEGGAYVAIAEAYRTVADRHGVAPRDLQAVVWVAVRGGDVAAEFDVLDDIARDVATVAAPVAAFVTPV